VGKGGRSQRGSDVACATWRRAIAKFVMSRRLFSCMHAHNLQPGAVGGCLHAFTKILSHRITERERPINARFGLRACSRHPRAEASDSPSVIARPINVSEVAVGGSLSQKLRIWPRGTLNVSSFFDMAHVTCAILL
jgi:hypothetical protein